MIELMSGFLAGEVLFAEVLRVVTPTGISKECWYVFLFACLPFRGILTLFVRLIEFASQDDSQRAIRELSEPPLLGRPVFIREVRCDFLFHFILDLDLFLKTGSGESRFSASTPVPGNK